MTRETTLRLLHTAPHSCGYWPERSARNLVLDPATDSPGAAFPQLLAAGFRRSGPVLYRPRCDACTACIPVRIPVADFRPDRSQHRCLARNADLDVTLGPSQCDAEVLELYARYIDARHSGSAMTAEDTTEFGAMFLAEWADTRFVCMRAGGRLLAVAVTDVTTVGCSAVYTFFDPAPAHAARSLGTFAILSQVALTRTLQLPHLYLGYWLDRHPAMHYKLRFRPQHHLLVEEWTDAQRTGNPTG